MDGTFKQLTTTHKKNPLRDPSKAIQGWFDVLPMVGQKFWFNGIGEDCGRLINTSTVKGIEIKNNEYIITTKKSTYWLKVNSDMI